MDNRHHDRRSPDDLPDDAGREAFERDELAGDELLSAYLDGECTAVEQAEVEARIAANPELRQLVEELRGVRASLEQLPQHRLTANFAEQVLRRAEREVLTGGAPPREAAAPRASPPPSDARPVIRPLADASVSLRPANETRSARPFLWAMVALAAAVVILVTNRDPEIRPDPIARGPAVNLPAQKSEQPAAAEAKKPTDDEEDKFAASRDRTDRAADVVSDDEMQSAADEQKRAKAIDSRADDTLRLESDERREKLATEKLATDEIPRADAAGTDTVKSLPRSMRLPAAGARARFTQDDPQDEADKQASPNLRPTQPLVDDSAKSSNLAQDLKRQGDGGETFRELPAPIAPAETTLDAAATTEAPQSAGYGVPTLNESRSAGEPFYARTTQPLRVVEVLVTRAAWQRGAVDDVLLKNRIALVDAEADTSSSPASGPATNAKQEQAQSEELDAKKELAEQGQSLADRKLDLNGEKAKSAGKAATGEAKEDGYGARGRRTVARDLAPAEAPPQESFGGGAQNAKQFRKDAATLGRPTQDREDRLSDDGLELLVVNATAAQIDATLSALGGQEEQMQVVNVTNASTPGGALLGEALSSYSIYGGRGLSDLSGVADPARQQAVEGAIQRLTKGFASQPGESSANLQVEPVPPQPDHVGQSIDAAAPGPPENTAGTPAATAPALTDKKSAVDSDEAIEPEDLKDRIQQSQSTAPARASTAPDAAKEPFNRPQRAAAPATRRVRLQSTPSAPGDASSVPQPAREADKSAETFERAPVKDLARKPALQKQKSLPEPQAEFEAANQERRGESEKKANLNQLGGGRAGDKADQNRQFKFGQPGTLDGAADGRGLGGVQSGLGAGGATRGGFGPPADARGKAFDGAGKPIANSASGSGEVGGMPQNQLGDYGGEGRKSAGGYGGGGYGAAQVPDSGYAERSAEPPTMPLGVATRVRLRMAPATERAIEEQGGTPAKDAPEPSAGLTIRANQSVAGREGENQVKMKSAVTEQANIKQRGADPSAGVAAAEGKRDARNPTAETAASLTYDPVQPLPAMREQAVFVFRIVDAPALAARGERARRADEAAKTRARADIAAEQQSAGEKAGEALPVPAPARPSPATLPAPPQPVK